MGKVNPIYTSSIPFHCCGIYKLTSPSNKIYIGQSIWVRKRLHVHKYNTEKSLKYPIGRAIKKYGFENFKIELLVDFKATESREFNINLLNHMEAFCIKKYKSTNSDFGYNIGNGGDAKNSMSESTRLKLREAFKGKHHTPESIAKIKANLNHSQEYKDRLRKEKTGVKLVGSHLQNVLENNKLRRKAVDQYDLKGDFIQTFESIIKAAEHVCGRSASISRVCSKLLGRKNYKKSIWRYKGEALDLPFTISLIKRAVVQYNSSMDIINTYESMAEAQRATGIQQATIGLCINKKKQKAGGFYWEELI